MFDFWFLSNPRGIEPTGNIRALIPYVVPLLEKAMAHMNSAEDLDHISLAFSNKM